MIQNNVATHRALRFTTNSDPAISIPSIRAQLAELGYSKATKRDLQRIVAIALNTSIDS